MSDDPKERGIWAEHYVRDFLSLPFVSEFVLHSVQTLDSTQKEVADFLIAYPGFAALISLKTQKDPLLRSREKTYSWAAKEAKRATSQLSGALRNTRGRHVWCDHKRMGRVDLVTGLPTINHGIVLVEVLERVDLSACSDELPLEYLGTPISYLSVNDFLNIAVELRTVPEMFAYLDARRSLPYTDLRVIGDERRLFEFYLLQGGSLAGCAGKADAAVAVAARRGELDCAVKTKAEHDRYSALIEHVADQLATRRADYAEGLSDRALAGFDQPDKRRNYLAMQAVLANLALRERSELGRAFEGVMRKRDTSGQGFTYAAMHMDSRPDWVFVLGSCTSIAPSDLQERKQLLMLAALAFYRKTHCLLIIDREKLSYEVGLREQKWPPVSPTEITLGESMFGHLRMTDRPLALVPGQ